MRKYMLLLIFLIVVSSSMAIDWVRPINSFSGNISCSNVTGSNVNLCDLNASQLNITADGNNYTTGINFLRETNNITLNLSRYGMSNLLTSIYMPLYDSNITALWSYFSNYYTKTEIDALPVKNHFHSNISYDDTVNYPLIKVTDMDIIMCLSGCDDI